MNWKQLTDSGVTVFGGAVSGGLDSCTVTHWLSERGVDVHALTVDLGQPDEDSLDDVAERMIACGASRADVLDGREALAEAGLQVIQSQARYEGGYWNTTGIARPVTVAAMLPVLAERGIDVLFHGATGRGNDQVRFQLVSNMLTPSLEVYAPWRDPEFVSDFPGRREMLDYCEANDLPIKPRSESRYSTDANFLGLTHEAGDLEDVTIPPDFVEPGMGVKAEQAPDYADAVTITWLKGRPIAIDGKEMTLLNAFNEANRLGGRHAVGIGTHTVENRFVGVKSRGIYEAPGMELLGQSYEYLLQMVLDRRARLLYQHLSQTISTQIYEGYWLDLATTSALAALEPMTKLASGTITVRLYKGTVSFESVEDVPNSLYTDDSSMEAEGDYDHLDAEGFLRIHGVAAKSFGTRQFPCTGR
jgi:argininosuccinate synthase